MLEEIFNAFDFLSLASSEQLKKSCLFFSDALVVYFRHLYTL